jgi:hypothetical protein
LTAGSEDEKLAEKMARDISASLGFKTDNVNIAEAGFVLVQRRKGSQMAVTPIRLTDL